MASFTIESPAPADAPECAALLVAQLAEHNVTVSSDELIPALNQVISDANLGFLLVTRREGRIIGIAYAATLFTVEHCGFVSSLEELYVLPEFRGLGIGSALLSAVIARATAEQRVAMVLEVDVDHHRAIPLYERHQFKPLNRSRWMRKLPSAESGPS